MALRVDNYQQACRLIDAQTRESFYERPSQDVDAQIRSEKQNHEAVDRLSEPLVPNIFAFLLFDDRPSHRAIEQFAAEELDWLDHLARAARITMFVYIGQHATHADKQTGVEAKRNEEIRRERIALVHSKEEIQNPGLEIARDLGIRPNQLPGIALFARLSDEKAAIFFPLGSDLFEQDSTEIERVLADFFSIIQESQEGATSLNQLRSELRDRIGTLRRTQQARPILLYAKETLLTVIRLPLTLPEVIGTAFAQTFAQETARRIAGP